MRRRNVASNAAGSACPRVNRRVRMLAGALTLVAWLGCGGAARGSASPASPASSANSTNSALPVSPAPTSGAFVAPSGVAYSRWEALEHQAMLTANGFSTSRESWRAAATTSVAPIRAAACALLAEAPVKEDLAALAAGAKHSSPMVRAWAALGLARLGGRGSVQVLRTMAAAPASASERAPLIAAVGLTRLGDAMGVKVLTLALANDELRFEAARRLIDIARLDPNAAQPLFARALRDSLPTVRSLALAQLEELRQAPARSVLEEFARNTASDPSERARAQRILASLDR